MPTLASSFLANELLSSPGATGFTGATGTRGTNGATGASVSGGIINIKQTVLTLGVAATFTSDPNCLFAQIIVIGGGGGGGGAQSDVSSASCAGGGGSGGVAIAWYTAAEIGSTAIYTIGNAGQKGGDYLSVTPFNGLSGGASTFDPSGTGATLTANGGNGGNGSNITGTVQCVAGGAGGTASGGQINITGIAGLPSLGVNSSLQKSGAGGDNPLGGGNSIGFASNAINNFSDGYSNNYPDNISLFFAEGGGGALNNGGVVSRTVGGLGCQGGIIITEFLK